MKVHLNPALAEQADSAMMQWKKGEDGQDQIDRFDVRANLDEERLNAFSG